MESIHQLYKVFLPKYLRSLPIPRTFVGLGKLSAEQWMNLLPVVLISFIFLFSLAKFIRSFRGKRKERKPKVNQSLLKEDPKVVTQMDIEDLPDKIAFCRCWRSKRFPLCDGSHNEHNSETRDNVGPLMLLRSGGD